jgi:hypothetical protein
MMLNFMSKIIGIFLFCFLFYSVNSFGDALIIDGVVVSDNIEGMVWANNELNVVTSDDAGKRINKYEEIISNLKKMKDRIEKERSKYIRYFIILLIVISLTLLMKFIYDVFFIKINKEEQELLDFYKNDYIKRKMCKRFLFYYRASEYSNRLMLFIYAYIFMISSLLIYKIIVHEYNDISLLIDDGFWEIVGACGVPVILILTMFKWVEDNLIKFSAIVGTKKRA